MRYYKIFLRLYGLKPLISKGDYNVNQDTTANNSSGNSEIKQIDIVIDDGVLTQEIVKVQKKFYKRKSVRLVLNYIYSIFVGILLLIPIGFALIKSIINSEGKYFTSSFFQIMFLSQFLTGYLVYRDKYIKKNMSPLETYNYISLFVYILSLLVSISLSLLTILLVIFDSRIDNNKEIYNHTDLIGRIFLVIYFGLHNFYAYNIFFVNGITFALILLSYKISIAQYKNKLESVLGGNLDNIAISDILKEFTEIKSSYTKVVKSLNLMFSTMTILGLLGCYFATLHFDTKYVNILTFIQGGCFIIIAIVYIFSINRIKNSAEDIRKLISGNRFITVFLEKSEQNLLTGDVYSDYEINPENNKSPSLQKNKTFISRRSALLLDEIKDDDVKRGQDVSKKIDTIKTMTYRNLININENGNSLDWIILYKKLSEDWEYFKILGFEITDVSLIQRVIAILITFIGLLRINERF